MNRCLHKRNHDINNLTLQFLFFTIDFFVNKGKKDSYRFITGSLVMLKKIDVENCSYQPDVNNILKSLDNDVAKSEDILMLGLATAMFSSLIAPIAPPFVLLPAVAFVFAVTTILANNNYRKMQKQFTTAMHQLDYQQVRVVEPLIKVFKESPVQDLGDGFNPLKNLMRTWKSVLGGIVMNPLWMPIFYVMGMHISEEKRVIVLNQVIRELETSIK